MVPSGHGDPASGNGGSVTALTCDACSGSLEVGVGGLATCAGCGKKYTREQLPGIVGGLSIGLKGGLKTGPVEPVAPAGPSRESLRELGVHAIESGNPEEAESYAVRLLESDPRDHEAWVLKGQAVAWQSSLRENRILEAGKCFAKGIQVAPKRDRARTREYVSGQMSAISMALIKQRASIYVQYPDPNQAEPFEADLKKIITAVTSTFGRGAPEMAEILKSVATEINTCVVKAWQDVILRDWQKDQYPNDYNMDQFTSRISGAIDLLLLSVDLSDDDDASDITRYNNMVLLAESRLGAKSYERTVNGYSVSRVLTDKAIAANNRLIRGWRDKIKELEGREEQRKRDAYWSTRGDERKALERKEKQLSARLKELQAQADDYPGREDLPEITKKLVDARAAHAATSRLKRAERKDLQNEIDALGARRTEIAKAQLDARKVVAEELTETERHLQAVKSELTKAR